VSDPDSVLAAIDDVIAGWEGSADSATWTASLPLPYWDAPGWQRIVAFPVLGHRL
jgi:hypothetical protein